ncbi:MAG: 3-deoxy-D-manno-octulosonic acid transferase [Thiomonas sp.]|uniref:Kdo transferase n=1 Tax=mine drainage metagenome TaxID=410659 RepID=E6PPY1_9ZZZZ
MAQFALRLYTLAWRFIVPLAVLRLIWRSRREPLYRGHLAERLGWYGRKPDAKRDGLPVLWLHAVSLGETRAAQPLLDALRAQHPRLRLLLTHMTATGREAGVALLREGDAQVWLPYDLPGPMRRFLLHFRPDLGVLMETEVWPNLAQVCAGLNTPLLLANARLSARSAARWAAWASLARSAFGSLTAAAAQTRSDADRLRKLGIADVSVLGNIKFDRVPNPRLRELGLQWKMLVNRPILLLASTREHQGLAEEELLLDAMPAGLLQRALLVVVPRHPQRMDAVHALLLARGLRVVRRSEALPRADTQVWLGDSLGEMPAYYAMADAAFVGGSLLPLGGQNLIEACAEGCPVVMGPHTFNFTQAVEQGVAAGAVAQARDASAAWSGLTAWLADARGLGAAREAALQFSAAHRGAAEAQAAWIGRYLPARRA